MFKLDQQSNYYYSDSLKIKHGFGTRKFSLNDLKELLNPVSTIIQLDQVHSNRVIMVNDWLKLNKVGSAFPQADALVYFKEQVEPVCLIIKTADCLPIILFDKETKVFGLIHSGWKGTLGNIVGKTIKKIQGWGSKISTLKAILGPGIGACCYNIPETRYLRFFKSYPKLNSRPYFLNLSKLCYLQMLEAGLNKNNIDWQNWCTQCQANTFFSYRFGDRVKQNNNISFGEL